MSLYTKEKSSKTVQGAKYQVVIQSILVLDFE